MLRPPSAGMPGTRRQYAGGESLAVLDVGTSKIVCFIAQGEPGGGLRIKGIGHQLSKGVRSSVITDFKEAETSILAAVHAAEQMAGETVENVAVSLSGSGLFSRSVTVEMALLGEAVSERDIMDIIEQGRASIAKKRDEHDIVHCFPVSYYLDGARGIVDPRQMYGEKLGADLHLITAQSSIVRNLAHCIGRCHLNVSEYIAAPHASAMACLDEDERELGVTLIDMGGGTTSFSVFSAGKNIYTDLVPIGGHHVTSDIAKGLSTTLAHAERLKTLHGSCIASQSDDQVIISAPILGEDESEEVNTMPRSMLVGIIRPRMEEIFEMIRGKIEMSGVEGLTGRRVVITGGASQLMGVRELAGRMLGKQVRLSRPKPVAGLAEAVSGPAFSTAIGMLNYVMDKPLEEQLYQQAHAPKGLSAKLKGLADWFRENF